MKIKKALLFLFIPFFADMLVACCDCEEPQLFKYTHTGLVLMHLDNHGRLPVITADDPVLKEAYGIRVLLKGEAVAFQQPSFSFFISRSYAFSCRCEATIQYLPKDSITGFRIITMNDFDPQHPAETDISDYFRLLSGYDYSTITDFLHKEAEIFTYDNPRQIVLDAMLVHPPTQKGACRFRVEIDLSDGRKFIKETSTIELI